MNPNKPPTGVSENLCSSKYHHFNQILDEHEKHVEVSPPRFFGCQRLQVPFVCLVFLFRVGNFSDFHRRGAMRKTDAKVKPQLQVTNSRILGEKVC